MSAVLEKLWSRSRNRRLLIPEIPTISLPSFNTPLPKDNHCPGMLLSFILMEPYSMLFFVTGFFCSTFYLWDLPILLCLVVHHSFFLQNSMLLCECTIIYPFTGWWEVASFWLLWMVHYEHSHVCLLVGYVCISTGYILRNGSAG